MIIHFEELGSTNSYLKEKTGELEPYTVVTARFQTAGRGQRGNSWESEAGKNLLMSMLYIPRTPVLADRQFIISKASSLGVLDALERLLAGYPHPPVTVKWPNDIYIGDRKAAGMLIENTVSADGHIVHSVIGVGLNVNQKIFRSSAPNPVSLIEFTGVDLPVDEVAQRMAEGLRARLSVLDGFAGDGYSVSNRPSEELDSSYRSALWRARGFHRYISLQATSAPAPTAVISSSVISSSCPSLESSLLRDSFEAEIVDVLPEGPIVMRLRDGSLHTFAFKEVAPVLGGV